MWDQYKADKKKRREWYMKFIATPEGYKKVRVKCVACNGSGYYDHNGSPKCGACNGTGKSKELVKI